MVRRRYISRSSIPITLRRVEVREVASMNPSPTDPKQLDTGEPTIRLFGYEYDGGLYGGYGYGYGEREGYFLKTLHRNKNISIPPAAIIIASVCLVICLVDVPLSSSDVITGTATCNSSSPSLNTT